MRTSLGRFVKSILLTSFVLSQIILPLHSAKAETQFDELVRRIDSKWRSSDRDIDARLLMELAYEAIGSEDILALARMSRDELLTSLESLKSSLDINQGIAENLIKLQAIQQYCGKAVCPWEPGRDWVKGLNRNDLDRLVNSRFSVAPTRADRAERDFDYLQYEKERMFTKMALDNDWYNFRVPAAMFMKGMHKTHTSTYQLFSRGTKNRAYFVAGGIDEVVHILKNLRFTEREITFLREHPHYSRIDAAFWDYLRNWKFTGSIRAVRNGTVMFANEPIMEITANPLDHHLIESIILPMINDATKSLTKSARVTDAMDGREWVEGGTRRSGNGRLSGLYAVTGGALGTSNTTVARIWREEAIKPYGSMPHAWVDYFDQELDAFLAYLELYPDSSVIGDTHDIIQGVKNAIRAGGRNLAGLREDSLLPGKDLVGTTQTVRALLNFFGYDAAKLGLSNRLNEYELMQLPSQRAPFQWGLVGSEIAAPSDAPGVNVVYKFAGVTVKNPDGTTTSKIKTKTSEGKPGIPGAAQIWRFESESGLFEKDVVSGIDETVEGNARPLLNTIVVGGEDAVPAVKIIDQKQYARAQVLKLPAEVRKPDAQPGVYKVELSPGMQKKLRDIKNEAKKDRRMKVGVVLGSFDPATESHKNLILRAKELYNLELVIVVPTGDDAVHRGKYKFNAEQRLKGLRQILGNTDGIVVDDREVTGKSRFSIDTLEGIKADSQYDLPADANIHIIGGEDLLVTLPTWKAKERLINEFSWVISSRGGSGKIELPPDLIDGYEKVQGSPRHLRSRDGKRIIEIVDLKTGNISATQVRAEMSAVDTIGHQVDTQETFWEGMHGIESGPLAVPGSAQITENVKTLAWLFKASSRVKAVSSGDFHYEVEVNQPDKWNPEFKIFKPHGMKYKSGPVGPGRIREVRDVFSLSEQLIVPNFNEIKGATPEQDRLEDAFFDPDAHAAEILDPNIEVIIQKNGSRKEKVPDGTEIPIEAYDWGINKYAEAVVKMINPQRVVVYGVATDWCVVKAVMRYRKLGYDVWLVTDAISHIFEKYDSAIPPSAFGNKDKAFSEMAAAGVKFVTTQDVVNEYKPSISEQDKASLMSQSECPARVSGLASK